MMSVWQTRRRAAASNSNTLTGSLTRREGTNFGRGTYFVSNLTRNDRGSNQQNTIAGDNINEEETNAGVEEPPQINNFLASIFPQSEPL